MSGRRASARIAALPKSYAEHDEASTSDREGDLNEAIQYDSDEYGDNDEDFEEPESENKQLIRGKSKARETTPVFNVLGLPLEIVTSILKQCSGKDLANMITLNKDFYAILSNPDASKTIWQPSRAAEGVYFQVRRGLLEDYDSDAVPQVDFSTYPNPPAGFTEIQYAYMLYQKSCTYCENTATRPQYGLGVKLCQRCHKKMTRGSRQILSGDLIQAEVYEALLSDSTRGSYTVHLVPDYKEIVYQYERLVRSDKAQLKASLSGKRDSSADGLLDSDNAIDANTPLGAAASAYLAKKANLAWQMGEFAAAIRDHEAHLANRERATKEGRIDAFRDECVFHVDFFAERRLKSNSLADYGVGLGHERVDIEEAFRGSHYLTARCRVAKTFKPAHWHSLASDLLPMIQEERDYRLMHQRWMDTKPVRTHLDHYYRHFKTEHTDVPEDGLRWLFPNQATFFDFEPVRCLVDSLMAEFPEFLGAGAELPLPVEIKQRLDNVCLAAEEDIASAIQSWIRAVADVLNARLQQQPGVHALWSSLTIQLPAIAFSCADCGVSLATESIFDHFCIGLRLDDSCRHERRGGPVEAVIRINKIAVARPETLARVIALEAMLVGASETCKEHWPQLLVSGTYTCVGCTPPYSLSTSREGFKTTSDYHCSSYVAAVRHIRSTHNAFLRNGDEDNAPHLVYEADSRPSGDAASGDIFTDFEDD